MHYEKFHRTEVAEILQHNTRGIDRPDTHKHSNENIDRLRTHLNYDLKVRDGLTAYQYYQSLIGEIEDKTKARGGKAIRKDAVTYCSWVVTVPETLPKEKYKDFFKGVYKFFAERYGEKNIVNADVHKDEVTDHIHLGFVPIVYDKKNGFEKLCAKNLETQNSLKKAHKDLQKYLEAELGCAVDILNGATVNGNKSIAELKLETTLEKVSEAEKKLDEAVDLVRNFTPSPTKIVKGLIGKKEVPKTVEELQNEKLIMTAQELLDRKEKIILEVNKKAQQVVSSAEVTAQKIISEAENSEIVLTAKRKANQIIQSANAVLCEAEIKKESTEDYCNERIALADEEAEERSRQLDEREAHINALAELSKPTTEYEERMAWLYDMSVRPVEEELEEEQEEDFEIYEDEIEEPEPDDYDFEF
jgi:hypothetical protein